METPTPVAEEAKRLGIDVLETPDVNAEDAVARITAAKPRLLVVVSFGQMLRRAVREAAPLGAINLHFSLLPRWRGAAPVQRAILAGDTETGQAVQRVVAKLDAGPLLAWGTCQIGPRDTTDSLRSSLLPFGVTSLLITIRRLLEGDPKLGGGIPQDESLVTYAAKIAKDEGDLDFAAETAVELDRRVRALGDAPGCRATLVRATGPMDVFVREAFPQTKDGEPGRVLAATADGIVVAAKSGALRITRLQRVGGKDVDARSFLNGFPVRAGDRFQRVSSTTSAS